MLCQLQDVKTYLGITVATTDNVLTALVQNASAFIESYCNRVFEQTAYVETRNGNGADRIFVRAPPIISITSVTVDNVTIPAAPDTISYGYVNDEDMVYLRTGTRLTPVVVQAGSYTGVPVTFRRGVQNVVLTYSGGYSIIPLDVNQACIELVALKFAKRDRIDKSNEVLAQQTVGFSMADMPAQVRTALSAYRIVMVPP